MAGEEVRFTFEIRITSHCKYCGLSEIHSSHLWTNLLTITHDSSVCNWLGSYWEKRKLNGSVTPVSVFFLLRKHKIIPTLSLPQPMSDVLSGIKTTFLLFNQPLALFISVSLCLLCFHHLLGVLKTAEQMKSSKDWGHLCVSMIWWDATRCSCHHHHHMCNRFRWRDWATSPLCLRGVF